MNPHEHIPVLQATASLLLPGMRHARSLMDVSIRVLEYFEQHAAREAITGKGVRFEPADPVLIQEAESLKAMFVTFGRLQERAKS
jgi:hypothetical protein